MFNKKNITALFIALSLSIVSHTPVLAKESENISLKDNINNPDTIISFNHLNNEAIIELKNSKIIIKNNDYFGIKNNVIIPISTRKLGNISIPITSYITIEEADIYISKEFIYSYLDSSKIKDSSNKSPMNIDTSTGKKYADGWTAPVLKSSWSSNHQTNLATLQNELGFTNNGMNYTINKADKAISIVGNSPSSSYELDVVFYMWDDDANGILTEAYRVPIVAKELFELYFGNDATKVWNYFNNDDIPDNFTANGRKVHAYYSSNVGALTLEIGRK